MSDLLRQLILLVMLLTLFEQLLPDGSFKQVGKMGLGLVMLLMLVTGLSSALKIAAPDTAHAAASLFTSEQLPPAGSYRDTVLRSGERQLAQTAEKAAEKAGYTDVQVTVNLNQDGSILLCRVLQQTRQASRLGGESLPDGLTNAIAAQLHIGPEKIIPFSEGGDGHGV